MGSISGRFSGLGSAINNSISRVGQPLLGALIFIAISATYYASLGVDSPGSTRPTRRSARAFQPLNPPAPARPPEQVAASNQASIEAFHLAMLVCAGLLVDRGARCRGTACARGAARVGRHVRRAAAGTGRVTTDDRCRATGTPGPTTGSPIRRRAGAPPSSTGCRSPATSGSSTPAAGAGRVTELLAERLPRGRVVALDGSPAMIDAARERLAPLRRPDRIRRRGPRRAAADRAEPVDAVLSTATFHWVPDHDALFANLAAVTATRRLARRAVRRRRQHRLGQAGPRDDRRRLARAASTSRRRWRRSAGSMRPASSTSNAG